MKTVPWKQKAPLPLPSGKELERHVGEGGGRERGRSQAIWIS